MTNLPIDTFKLPVMLTALRLPSFQKHWQEIAEQADKEAWPAARFLAVLAEYEMAEWTCHSFVPVPCSVFMQLFVQKPVGFSSLMLSGDDVGCKTQ